MRVLTQPMAPDLIHGKRINQPVVGGLSPMQMVHSHEQEYYLGSYIRWLRYRLPPLTLIALHGK